MVVVLLLMRIKQEIISDTILKISCYTIKVTLNAKKTFF